MKTSYSLAEVAAVCSTDLATVIRWRQSGDLMVPSAKNGGDRVRRRDLIRFMNERNMPVEKLGKVQMGRTLIFGVTRSAHSLSSDLIKSLNVELCLRPPLAGIETDVSCILVDFSVGQDEALDFARTVRRQDEFADVMLIALVDSGVYSSGCDLSGFDERFNKDCLEEELLAFRIKELVGRKLELQAA